MGQSVLREGSRSVITGGVAIIASSLLLIGALSTPLAEARSAGTLKKDCSLTSTGMTPIVDLIGGSYRGSPGARTALGGLYPGGTNSRPNESEVRSAANSIGPLDPNGNPDPNGRYGLLSIGMSNTEQEFQTFLGELAQGNAVTDPDLVVVNGAQGGVDARQWADPSGKWWIEAENHVRSRGLTPNQVAVVWVKLAIGAPSAGWPTETERLQGYLAQVARILKDRFPNVQIAYYSSRIYAGYTTRGLNPEPYAYESGFAVKWLIDDQLRGDPALNPDPSKGTVQAPLITWGPYLWADGLRARSDGFVWECGDFLDDGTHPSDLGTKKVADLLLDFFETDSTARQWFLKGDRTTSTTLNAAPNQVAYGAPFVLSGIVSGDPECVTNATVTILKRPLSTDSFTSAVSGIAPSGEGRWSLTMSGRRSTEFVAEGRAPECKTIPSEPATVLVNAQ
jgi:hypothetical protein